MKKNQRFRNWLFIVYPESAPADWIDQLDQLHVEACISPLHDKDINPTGEPKKPHYHVLLAFDGVQTYSQVEAITDSLQASKPIVCKSVKGSVRYFAHLDNPEKYRYNTSDIKSLSGFDIAEALKPSSADRYTLIGEMIEFVQEFNILEFEDLILYAKNFKQNTWFPILCDNSSFLMTKFIDSRRYRYRSGERLIDKELIDVNTGEILRDMSFLFKDEENEESNDQ